MLAGTAEQTSATGAGVDSEEVPSHGHPQSISLVIPPLGMLVLKIGNPATTKARE